ncbi:polyprenyl diphosphate synthase [Haladaptatus sp. DYSN1]|uniref:polyprenyl diphosphate synthase n=1 Tax=unclassified Haladaptatus TaxID=2622732 RepID=UPI0024065C85|nr:polyprenyl diphosphate synthase [Haladaptatus sp. DYSN1]
MRTWVRTQLQRTYERLLLREISGAPTHVAVIQDGNRRYASEHGEEANDGHRQGAKTTENLLYWCDDLGIEELTLYTFSTENFNRPPEQREYLFDLICEKLTEFADADRVHEGEVRIRAIGQLEMLPPRVQEAIEYAHERTKDYDRLRLNIALAYGGRAELLEACRGVARSVHSGTLAPADITVETLEERIYDGPARDVDLIIRTGGDERTSNFLPWHANGNEAAVFFCTPYWPEFSKIDFLRSIRTYEAREASWRRTRAQRAVALVKSFGGTELDEAKRIIDRFRDQLPSGELEGMDVDDGRETQAD